MGYRREIIFESKNQVVVKRMEVMVIVCVLVLQLYGVKDKISSPRSIFVQCSALIKASISY